TVQPVNYVALLRGINLGDNNIIKMLDLKACFEDEGFENVSTYIASGNVLFGASAKEAGKLVGRLEKLLSKRFGYESRVVVCSQPELAEIVASCPKGFG